MIVHKVQVKSQMVNECWRQTHYCVLYTQNIELSRVHQWI